MNGPQLWRDDNEGGLEKVDCEVLERNGNLVYVEDEQGNRDWVSDFELEG